MKKEEALSQGLHFTGIYNSDKEETKKQIAIEQTKYPKARIILVRETVSKLSRSFSPGAYSAYADDKYSAYKTIENAVNFEEKHANVLKRLKKEYDETIAQENARFENETKKISNALQTLGEDFWRLLS